MSTRTQFEKLTGRVHQAGQLEVELSPILAGRTRFRFYAWRRALRARSITAHDDIVVERIPTGLRFFIVRPDAINTALEEALDV